MKKTLIALAAAATVSLGAIGTASAAPNAGLDFTAQNGAVQKVGHHFGYRYGYRYGYGYGYGHGYAYGYQFCKELYYKGYVLGWDWARFKYIRHCAYKYNY